MNGSPGFHVNQPHWNGSPDSFAVKQPVLSVQHAISRQLLLTGTPCEQRLCNADRLTNSACIKLNGFASKAAEKSAIQMVAFTDYPRLKEAYERYAAAAGVYKDVLEQLEPGSDEAIRVRGLLIDSHKSCIKTIYLILDALERAPGKKSIVPYLPWEQRACEAIKEIDGIGGLALLKEIPELRD